METKKNYRHPQLFLHSSAVSGSWSLGRRNLRSGSTNLRNGGSDSSGSWSCSVGVGAGGISRPVAKLPGDKKTI